MKLVLKLVSTLLIVFLSVSTYAYDSVTTATNIESHQSQMNGNILYVRAEGGSWPAVSTDGNSTPCPNTQQYIYIAKNQNSGYEDVFSSVLAAAASGKKVSFFGFCDNPSVGHFNATHINVYY